MRKVPLCLLVFMGVCMGLVVTGCSTVPVTMQLRMAEPTVSDDGGCPASLPVAVFSKMGCDDDVQSVQFGWENPSYAINNRVNLDNNSTYWMSMTLPTNYEFRRMQILQGKSETLYNAIRNAETQLSENMGLTAKLLSQDARATLISESAGISTQISGLQVQKVTTQSDVERGQIDGEIERLVQKIKANEAWLKADDEARDKLLAQPLVESLTNQIEDWRTELNRIKARIVALRLMVENGNEPYPRVINGIIQTYLPTEYTSVSAIPFRIEDEYLDWLREDKVVTIVSYDPYSPPENPHYAAYRGCLPQFWKENDLMILEYTNDAVGVARAARGGLAGSTQVSYKEYPNVAAREYAGPAGQSRVYLHSSDGTRMWVFGSDITPPDNLEVWTQDAYGKPKQKLYPGGGRMEPDVSPVHQIVGVEGGGVDPVAQAQTLGTILAVTRLGNIRTGLDQMNIHGIYNQEVQCARARMR
ncbi:MAG TPA: hypothetical protein PKO23_06920 [Candidatus Hydrogenedentes bacterium]|nr:hypothetical protein [Candidatus Hydrogenedentota bacterium]HOC68526.1 hypothetical protein [Candidatus Hydrogenedentota bacterium]